MRVTNLMMTTNMLNNITKNKADMNTKFNQYATGQKIQKPSEDPVVAIRSLKYRANLTEITQYAEKNIPDAYEWMDITESALSNMNSLLEEMYSYCTQGSSDTYETIDRDSIQQSLQQYKEEIYTCLNADNAGRYVFSGYRTDTAVCYEESTKDTEFEIFEPLTFENLFEKAYIAGGATYVDGTTADEYKAQAPNKQTTFCINLAYKKLNELQSLTYVDETGAEQTLTFQTVRSTDDTPFDVAAGEVNFVKDTGELIISQEVYEKLRTAKSISAQYTKNEFDKGDVRPQMYFDCVGFAMVEDATGNMVRRGEPGVNYTKPQGQDIYYDVNFRQNLKVNTMANETLNTTFGRKIDNILDCLNDAYSTQREIDSVDLMLMDTQKTEAELEALGALKEQLQTELVLKKSLLQQAFGAGMTAIKEAQDGTKVAEKDGTVNKISTNIALTSLGSRYKRLQLVENRLQEQTISFTDIMTNNESVDLEDAIINYNAAEVTYNASLSAASKVVKNSLLDFL